MLSPIKTDDGKFCIVSSYGEVKDKPMEFFDPNTGQMLKLDPYREKWTPSGETKLNLPSNIADQREKIQAAMDDYAEQHYRTNKGTVMVYAQPDGTINIVLSFRDVNISSFWTGQWRGTYTLKASSSGSATLSADVHTAVHYYEDGNVQLYSSANTESKIVIGSPEETASKVVDIINRIENEFQEGLEKMYLDIHRVTFKRLRRFLPCSRQRMKWDIAIHMVNEDLAGSQE